MNSHPNQHRDLTDFAEQQAELTVSQWISEIDKVATKPAGGKLPTLAQRALREKLGDAALPLVMSELQGLNEGEKKRWKEIWWEKIHPYKIKNDVTSEREVRGRWYKTFAGEVDPNTDRCKADRQQR